MNKKSVLKKNKGSGILVVILSSIAFSIYSSTAFLDIEHFSILLDKYEKNNKEYYERYVNNIDEFYNLYENEQSDIMYL